MERNSSSSIFYILFMASRLNSSNSKYRKSTTLHSLNEKRFTSVDDSKNEITTSQKDILESENEKIFFSFF